VATQGDLLSEGVDRTDPAQAKRFLQALSNIANAAYLLRGVWDAPPERLSDAQRADAVASLMSWLGDLLDHLERVDQEYVAGKRLALEELLDRMARGEEPGESP
jgi:hypothetical protein